MNLDNLMLNERNQTQKVTYVSFYLYEMSKINKYRQRVDEWFPGDGRVEGVGG